MRKNAIHNVNFNPLYRPVLDGKEFSSLIKKGGCKRTGLPTGDTHLTINLMTDWVKKHYKQTEKIARRLQSTSKQKTVDNIYWFLYNHFQYEADGQLQQLRSPECSWAHRYNGIDCKSYSIFASCLLTNMGIAHYIREVRQPNEAPDQFTHVYIIVPKKGKSNTRGNYYVIDGTKHYNTEVPYLEAKDTFMSGLPHVGLNGPSKAKSYKRGLRLPAVADRGLNDFLQFLMDNGVNRNLIAAVRKEVNMYLSMGVDPKFNITPEGIIVQRKLFRFNMYQGLSFPGPTAPPGGVTTTPPKGGGIGGSVLGVAQLVLGSKFFQDTIGSIFANGFDLSCWGSSYSPSKAKEHVQVDMPFIVQHSGIGQQVNSQTLFNFMNFAEAYRLDAEGGQNPRFAKCTRKGHEFRQKNVEALVSKVLNDVQNQFTLTQTGQAQGGVTIQGGLPGYARGRTFKYDKDNREAFFIPVYSLTPKSNNSGGGINTGGGTITVTNPTGGNNTTGGGFVTTANPNQGNQQVQNNPSVQKAGMGAAGWLLVAGVAGTLLAPQIKKAISKN